MSHQGGWQQPNGGPTAWQAQQQGAWPQQQAQQPAVWPQQQAQGNHQVWPQQPTPPPGAWHQVPAQVVVWHQQMPAHRHERPRYVDGMSAGENAFHLFMTIMTVGIWYPVWAMVRRGKRKRIIY